ncbi:hypothetical protein FRC07_008796 [Ceratobasidium sp. 392]|nr:hypothetical protein FRC07_008796 [Ceratobasidium sp. 392]
MSNCSPPKKNASSDFRAFNPAPSHAQVEQKRDGTRLALLPAPIIRSDTKLCNPFKNVKSRKSSSSDTTRGNSDNRSSSKSRASGSKSNSKRKNLAQPANAPTPIELDMSSSPAHEQTCLKKVRKILTELNDKVVAL